MRVLFLLLLPFLAFGDFSKTAYPFCADLIDVVIPCHPKDRRGLEICIQGIRKNGANVRRIIVISSESLSAEAEWFDEANFPFDKEKILIEIFDGDCEKARSTPHRSRAGWMYQQLLKLYACYVIPNLSPNYLVLDADTIFLRPVHFLSHSGEPLFNVGGEHYSPYFDHAKRLLPGFQKVFPNRSGITHHMIFQKPVLDDLFSQIWNIHGVEPWKAIVQCIDVGEIGGSSFSEYEIYFNFVFLRTDQAHVRKLKWKNIKSLHEIKECKKKGYDYVSCHVY